MCEWSASPHLNKVRRRCCSSVLHCQPIAARLPSASVATACPTMIYCIPSFNRSQSTHRSARRTHLPKQLRSPMFALFIRHFGKILAVVLAAGLLGNFAVLVASATKSTAHKVVNIYLAHLAVADLLHLVSIVPFIHLTTVNSWHWGTALCKVNYMIHYTNWTASIFIITALGFDRFVAVVTPDRSDRLRSRRFVWGLLLSLWALSGLIVSPIGFLTTVTAWFVNGTEEKTRFSCGHFAKKLNRSSSLISVLESLVQNPKFFSACAFSVGFALPFLLLAAFYGLIIRKLLTQSRATTAGVQVAQRRFGRVTRMVAAVIVLYTVCTLPHWIHVGLSLAGVIGSVRVMWITSHASTLLGYLNSAFNPVLYAWFNKPFRRGLQRCLTPCLQRCLPRTCLQRLAGSGGPSNRDENQPAPRNRDAGKQQELDLALMDGNANAHTGVEIE